MLSNLLDTNAVEITSAQPPLRLVPATRPKVLNDCLVKPIDFDRLESFLVPHFHQSSWLARFARHEGDCYAHITTNFSNWIARFQETS